MEQPDIFMGFKDEDLREAFDQIKNPLDWKREIDTLVPAEDFYLYNASVIFFTATEVRIVCDEGEMVRIHASGYRSGPCGG